jgi:hypothetical protein
MTTYSLQRVKIQGWEVDVVLDEDGDLSLYVRNRNGRVTPIDADIADDDNSWAERFLVRP